MAAGHGLEVADVRVQGRGVGEAGEGVEHLGDAVVWGVLEGLEDNLWCCGVLVLGSGGECTHRRTW